MSMNNQGRPTGVGTAGTSGSGINLAFGNQSVNNRIPVDLYNIDAIEISRGPNSNLFGLGASAGTVNLVPSLANLNRATTSVALRFDDWGGHRESFNLSRPLIPGKLVHWRRPGETEWHVVGNSAFTSWASDRIEVVLPARPLELGFASFERRDVVAYGPVEVHEAAPVIVRVRFAKE